MAEEFDPIHVEPLSDAESRAAAAARMREAHQHVDQVIKDAVARGEFDNLPGFGKPLQLGDQHDPDWWIKGLVEREKITVLPPSIQLRRDDAELDDLLDKQATEEGARQLVEDFNDRVLAARYSTPVGPPLITMPRDVEETIERWRVRRRARVVPDAGASSEPSKARTRQGLPGLGRLFGRRTHE